MGYGEEEMRNRKRVVVTWNARQLSVRETIRKFRRVAERVTRKRWEMVLLTELRAEVGGMV